MAYMAVVASEGAGFRAWSASFPEWEGRGETAEAALIDLGHRVSENLEMGAYPPPMVEMRLVPLQVPGIEQAGLPAPLDLLSREHRVVDGLLGQLHSPMDDPNGTRKTLAFLGPLLERHFQAEEDFWLPALRAAFSGPPTPVKVLEAEHRILRQLVAEAMEEGIPDVLLARRVSALVEVLKRHATKEEHQLLPMSTVVLNPATLLAMAERVQNQGRR